MTSDFDKRRAKFAEMEQAKEKEDRKGEVIIGEVTGKVNGVIERKSGGVRIKIDHIENLMFQPLAELKKGDSIRVTIEKV